MEELRIVGMAEKLKTILVEGVVVQYIKQVNEQLKESGSEYLVYSGTLTQYLETDSYLELYDKFKDSPEYEWVTRILKVHRLVTEVEYSYMGYRKYRDYVTRCQCKSEHCPRSIFVNAAESEPFKYLGLVK